MRRIACIIVCGWILAGCVYQEHLSMVPPVTPVTRAEVIARTVAGYEDEAILERIRMDGVDRRPIADDILAMKQAGVSSAVMEAMLRAPVAVPQPAREHRTVVVRDYSEPALLVGVAALAGYLMGHHLLAGAHVEYYGCGY